MDTADFDLLQGRDMALHTTLGVLVRHLHVTGIIDAPDLVREMRLVAAQIDLSHPAHKTCIDCMGELAQSFEDAQLGWSEERVIHDLYRVAPGTGQSGRS